MDVLKKRIRWLVTIIEDITIFIYAVIAAVLTLLALLSFYDVFTVILGIFSFSDMTAGILQGLHALLVTIIIVEILETVTVYFRTSRLQVRPILIAGLTAMVRRVLVYGVDSSAPLDIALTLAAIVVLTMATFYIGKEERNGYS